MAAAAVSTLVFEAGVRARLALRPKTTVPSPASITTAEVRPAVTLGSVSTVMSADLSFASLADAGSTTPATGAAPAGVVPIAAPPASATTTAAATRPRGRQEPRKNGRGDTGMTTPDSGRPPVRGTLTDGQP